MRGSMPRLLWIVVFGMFISTLVGLFIVSGRMGGRVWDGSIP
jgi:hypothetical protein